MPELFQQRESIRLHKGISGINIEKIPFTREKNGLYTIKYSTLGYMPLSSMYIEYKKDFTVASTTLPAKQNVYFANFAQPSFSWYNDVNFLQIKVGDSFQSVQEDELNKNLAYRNAYAQSKTRTYVDNLLVSKYGLREINTQVLDDTLQTSSRTLNASSILLNNQYKNLFPIFATSGNTTITKSITQQLSDLDPFFDSDTALEENLIIDLTLDMNVTSKNYVIKGNTISITPTNDAPYDLYLVFKRIILQNPYVGLMLTNNFNTFALKFWTASFVNPYKLSLTIDIEYHLPEELYFFLTDNDAQKEITVGQDNYMKFAKTPTWGFYLSEIKVAFTNSIKEKTQLLLDNPDFDVLKNSATWNDNNELNGNNMAYSFNETHGWDYIPDSPYVLTQYKPLTVNLSHFQKHETRLPEQKYLKVSITTLQGPWTNTAFGARQLVVMTRYPKKYLINGRRVLLQSSSI